VLRRAALFVALTLATAASAAQQLGAPPELAPQLELKAPALENSRQGVSANLDGGTGARAPSTRDCDCEIFVVARGLAVVRVEDSFSLYAFAAFDPINKRDPFGLTDLIPGQPNSPRPVPPPGAPAPTTPAPWNWSPPPELGPSAGPGAPLVSPWLRGGFLGGLVIAGALGMNAWIDSPVSFPGVNTLTEPGAGTPGRVDFPGADPTHPGVSDPVSAGTPDVPIGDPAGPSTVVQVGGERSKNLTIIEGQVPVIEGHLEKLKNDPESIDRPGWHSEIDAAIKKIEEKLDRGVGQKTEEEWRKRVRQWRERQGQFPRTKPEVKLSGVGGTGPGVGGVPPLRPFDPTGGLGGPGRPGGTPGGGGLPSGDPCRKASSLACRR
jgi:hypothetical protein